MTKEERIKILRGLLVMSDSNIQKLDEMGFFTAPASTKFHGDYEGGLFDHSLEVTNALIHLTERLNLNWERGISPIMVGMFHDLCKCDQYEVISHPCDPDVRYGRNDKVLLKGHGEKSVMLLSQFYNLTEEEILCIRYHMGAYETDEWNEYDRAIRKYPNVLFTHTADMIASKISGV